MLDLYTLINALHDNGIVHVSLEAPEDPSVVWWLQVNPKNLHDPDNTGLLFDRTED